MPPIPTGHVLLKFRFTLVGDAEEMIVTQGAETTATSNTERLAAVNDAFGSWQATVLPLQSNFYQLAGVDGVFGDASGDIPIRSTSGPVTGGNAAGVLPQNCAVLVKKVTSLGGRRNRGRFYVPGLSETDVDSTGTILTTPLANWGTAVNNLQLGLESDSFLDRLVIFHSSAPLTPTIVADLDVDRKIATQRRRLRP